MPVLEGAPTDTSAALPAGGLPPVPAGLYHSGGWHAGAAGRRIVTAPMDGRRLAEVAEAGQADLDAAVAAAGPAQRIWAALPPLARGKALREAAARIRADEDALALIDALDSGNPIRGMRFDVGLGATLMEYFAGLVTEAKGETIPQAAGKLTYVRRVPLGVVARIVPFNHPLMFAAAKIAAPLAAGNAVILKPSEETPLSALRMAELIGDLFPPGLLAVLTGGRALGAAIAAHPGIAALGLIGSVPTGRAVLRGGADTLKRTQLELGGKNALVVCPDADPEAAIAGAVKGMNLGWTAGQSCGSTSRLLVHESLRDRVVAGVKAAFDAIRPGDPTLEETGMGCLSTRAQYDKVTAMIARAEAEGARILSGGPAEGVPEGGLFVRPTLIEAGPETEIAREEVFGPVLTVLTWREEEEAIALANALPLGLTASIWTRDLARAMRLTERIDAGYTWVNDASDHYLGAPFGGVKHSGIGREECLEELLAHTEPRTVTIVAGQTFKTGGDA